MPNEEKFFIGALVNNQFGVLTRVAGLFARRGYNIDSLTVGITENPGYSRMTIAATGDAYIKEQIVKQLAKLHDVKRVELLNPDTTVIREQLLVKIGCKERARILEAAQVFRANVVDFSPETITIELTGESGKLEAFLEYVKDFGVLEVCRTGAAALQRGSACLQEE